VLSETSPGHLFMDGQWVESGEVNPTGQLEIAFRGQYSFVGHFSPSPSPPIKVRVRGPIPLENS